MTVNQIVSYIRGAIKQHDRTKGPFVDEYLWDTFLIAKSGAFSNYRLRRFNYINPQNYTSFCMELEESKSHACGCILFGCDVLATKFKLPKYFSGRNTSSLKVTTIGNTQIDIIDENEFYDVYQYDDIYKDKILGSIVNDKIIIWNTLDLEVLQVRALWEDITEIDDIQYCSSSDSSIPNCIDVYNKDIGVDMDLVEQTMEGVFRLLNIPMNRREDVTNNSNDNE